MTREDVCMVVPTVRNPECIREYVANAREHGHADRLHVVLVTEDFCDTASMREMIDDLGVSGRVFAGSDREEWFRNHGIAERADLIPEASHAETSFGLLYLWDREFEYGIFVDDDTRPHPDFDFVGGHLANLNHEGEVTVAESDRGWVNVLYQGDHDLFPRGYPYEQMDATVDTHAAEVDDVVVSQGLWTGVPDLDAVRILMDGDLQGQADTRLSTEDYGADFVTAPDDYLTVCSMNLAFRREVVPAFYQLPMGDNPWDVDRFDDIWSGVFLKRACDVLGTSVYSGAPLCVHEKAPRSTFGDLRAEAPALELNEHLWRIVDDVGGDRDTYAGVYDAMATALADGEFDDYENGDFLAYVGEYMREWLACLDELRPGARASAAAADD